MFIEKEVATPAVVIQDTKVRQRLDNNHLAQAPEKKHPSLNISLEERKKVELRQERKSMETEERQRKTMMGKENWGKDKQKSEVYGIYNGMHL